MKRVAAPIAAACVALGGCATHHDRIVLLPDSRGHVGKLMVGNDKGETLLETPYSAADVKGDGGADHKTLDSGAVMREFSNELAFLPARPESFFVYFDGNSDLLNAESAADMPRIVQTITQRQAYEVTVIGHTDTQADFDYNERLSLLRAMAIKAQLVTLGLEATRISVVGRGERDLAVPTADGVAEARNRRVEINVR